MYKVKVKRPFRGLHEGDVLDYNNENSMFELRESGEIISENFQTKNTKYVSFSYNFVESLIGQVFEFIDPETGDEVDLSVVEEPTCECKQESEPARYVTRQDFDELKNLVESFVFGKKKAKRNE